LGEYYESPDYISHADQNQRLTDRIYRAVRKRAIASKRKLIQAYVDSGKALDVGCGTGVFLQHLQGHGFQTTGVEPSTIAREQAIANFSLRVLPDLESIPPMSQFNVITMWHVLEHMPQPHETMKQLHARAGANALLVIAVPDRESWDAGHYEADWAAYDVPRHLSHFRRRDIGRLLNEHGFTLQATRRMWFDAPYVSMLTERGRGANSLVALAKGVFWGTLSNLVALTTARPTSSTLYIARKTGA
jgi:2-polyprenyl-3-methyl-5-hydroxy-6-metoxy-1,4-benzoquinol methylase